MIQRISQIYTIVLTTVLVVAAMVVGVTHNSLEPTVSQIAEAHEPKQAESVSDRQDILWLARVVYSETKRPQEQVLVAWIARNRVESRHFSNTYKAVAVSRGQFSGLNSFDKQYRHNITRDYKSGGSSWKSALDAARAVYYADAALRPFSKKVRHFYSPKSVKRTPSWAEDKKPVYVIQDPRSSHVRFAFFEGVQ